MSALPVIRLLPGQDRRAAAGHPWVFANEVAMDAQARELPPGALVRLQGARGESLGVAGFNRHALIAARLLDRRPDAAVDRDWFRERLAAALALRGRLFPEPFHRLVHAEADRLPGLILDRYGDVLVAQLNTATMDRLAPALIEACRALLEPRAIVLRNDSAVRALEGLEAHVGLAHGELAQAVEIVENGARFPVDPLQGQKTGWFFDQRDNRAFVATLARDLTMLDMYAHSGGFAITAARAGARRVTAVDRSQGALDLAEAAARLNGVADRLATRRAEAFAELKRLDEAGERFGVVVADPPAFVRARKDLKGGLRAYRKLARLAARVVAPGGFLLLASCSHHVDPPAFAEQVGRGLVDAGRMGRILREAGAGPDHPAHPLLPESAYLKALALQLD